MCVCVRSRRVCEAASCVRRARHVIQRNPPPETRGSQGDSIGYKESGNICSEQSKAEENISAPTLSLYSLHSLILPPDNKHRWSIFDTFEAHVVQQPTVGWIQPAVILGKALIRLI